jgi:acyl-CoA thioesterase FadM
MALLDETAGRVAMLERRWVMTMKLETRFRSPVRIGERLIIRGTPIRWRGRILEAKAEVLLPDGSVAVDARGVYVRLPKVIAADTAERLPEFERFWERTDVG